jgi:PKD repeat protein
MMKKSLLLLCPGFLFLLNMFVSSQVNAQPATKDVNINRDPMVMVPGYVPPSADQPMATVVTIGDYDNFKLGVDFAECSIANNPRNPMQYYATWNTTGAAGGHGYYTNNGYDWTAGNPSWTGMMGDVVVTYDSLGNLAYSNMYGNITGAKVAMSTDNGQTWGSAVNAILGNDKNWMTADQTAGPYANYLLTTMTGGAGGNVARSTNMGVSWQNITNLSTQSLPGMSECVGPEGAIQGGAQYVVTNSGSSFASTYTFYKSSDGGLTFQQRSSQQFSNYVGSNVGGRNSVQNMRTRPYPYMAADNSYGPHRGRLYLVYASNNPSGNGNKPDIYCRYSDNGATTWSTPKVVNDDVNSQANYNWFPAIWCEKETGRLYVSWMDTRDCPSSDSSMIYASYSDDGVTFAQNQRISNKKAKINCTSCGGGGTPAYLGDYNGVAANTLGSMLAWTDFRDGNFASYVGYFPDFASKATPSIDTLAPFATFYLNVPSVKLFTDTVFVTATVSGAPGLFTISYPQGNKLWSYPGSVPVKISGNGAVPFGDYVVTLVAKGSNGTPVHKRSATLRVLTVIAPLADFTASGTNICTGSSVNFTDLSSGPPSSWSWTFSGGTPASSNSSNPTGIVYNTPGTYDVSLTVTNAQGNNTVTKTGYINVAAVPDPPTALNQSVCEGGIVPDLTAEGDNIKWYSNPSLMNLVYQGSSFATGKTLPGVYTYYVTQTTNSCQSAGTMVTLSINARPVVTFNALSSVCANAPAFDLTGGEPTGGIYSGAGVSENGLVFDPSIAGPGTFDLAYVFSNIAGCSDTAYQTITINAVPDVTLASINPVCAGTSAFEITSGSPEGGTYTGNGISGNMFDPSVAGVGNSIITYSISDGITGCQNSTSTTIVVNSLPSVDLGIDHDLCANLNIVIDATVSNAQSYLWLPGGQTSATILIDTLGIGLHAKEFYVIVTDVNNCSANDSIKIQFHDCTGIDETGNDINFNIYPNPTKGIISIRSASIQNTTISIQVYTSSDKLVYNEARYTVAGLLNKTLNLQHLSDGVYLLKIQDTENRWIRRFIIRK